MTINQPARTLALKSVLPVWSLAIVGSILIAVIAPAARYLTWLPIVFAAAVILTFCIQLALVQKEGLVNRMMACIGGSVLILGLATIVLGIIQLNAT